MTVHKENSLHLKVCKYLFSHHIFFKLAILIKKAIYVCTQNKKFKWYEKVYKNITSPSQIPSPPFP